MANDAAQAKIVENVPCPFCALLCDDLQVAVRQGRVEVQENGCKRSRKFFSVPDAIPSPAVSGKPATLDAALSHAIGILRSAKHPRIISAGADVAGVRAMLALAERMQGSVDHADSPTAFRNMRVLQDAGWIATTLSEVRNRADLLVLAGVDIATHLPRFLERCFGSDASMFGGGHPGDLEPGRILCCRRHRVCAPSRHRERATARVVLSHECVARESATGR